MKTTKANRSFHTLLPLAALLAAAACADTGDLGPADEVEGPSRVHLMPMPGASRAPAKVKDESTDGWGQGGYNFTYRGGPVISKVKVVTVFWNSAVQNQSGINGFYQAIVQSPHLDWLSEYNTPTQKIGRGSFLASYVDTGAPTSKSLKNRDIQKEVARLINNGSVPAPDADTLYMVHFPAGVSIDMDGNISCQQYCAYHGTFTNDGKSVYYGVMPDFSGGCSACGGTNDKLQNTTIVSSHELVEAITDPAIGLANAHNDASYLAWYDDQYGEIGDVCQSEAGLVNGWAVQAEYSMQAGSCVITRPGVSDGGGDTGGGDTGGSTGGGAACGHAICAEGAALTASCDSCAEQICAADAYCCSTEWDRQCVSEVKSICNQTCGAAPTADCSHGVCLTGGPLQSTCGACTAKICEAEPSCCTDAWTTSCTQKAVSICGKKCE